jgi:outer membrane biosynthesis protein TonB
VFVVEFAVEFVIEFAIEIAIEIAIILAVACRRTQDNPFFAFRPAFQSTLLLTSFSFVPAAAMPAPPSGFGVQRYRFSRGAGLLAALLLHALLLWMLLARDPLVIKPPTDGTEGTITFIAPLADARQPKPITPPMPKPPTPPVQEKQPRRPTPPKPPKPITRPITKPVTKPVARPTPAREPQPVPEPQLAAEPLTPAPNVAQQQAPAPAEDFSARIEANRKRRAEAIAQDPALAQAASETADQRASRIARENVAFSQRGQGAERDQTGGVFQLRDVRTHSAEFMFRGWNNNFKRNWSQLVAVDQGSEADIETAVVKRMIALIRSHKEGEFIWESHRLGRQITLNADPAYETELRQFLLKEFFPTYVRTAGHG